MLPDLDKAHQEEIESFLNKLTFGVASGLLILLAAAAIATT